VIHRSSTPFSSAQLKFPKMDQSVGSPLSDFQLVCFLEQKTPTACECTRSASPFLEDPSSSVLQYPAFILLGIPGPDLACNPQANFDNLSVYRTAGDTMWELDGLARDPVGSGSRRGYLVRQIACPSDGFGSPRTLLRPSLLCWDRVLFDPRGSKCVAGCRYRQP